MSIWETFTIDNKSTARPAVHNNPFAVEACAKRITPLPILLCDGLAPMVFQIAPGRLNYRDAPRNNADQQQAQQNLYYTFMPKRFKRSLLHADK